MRNILLVIAIFFMSHELFAAYSTPVKITSVESQGSDVSVYIDNGSAAPNPAACQVGSGTQLFLNNGDGLERSYAAALAALSTGADVQVLVSNSLCRYNLRVVTGFRILK